MTPECEDNERMKSHGDDGQPNRDERILEGNYELTKVSTSIALDSTFISWKPESCWVDLSWAVSGLLM
jgi:hypothetical protein